MSISDTLSVISLVLGTAAIIIAFVIYRRQNSQSERQFAIISKIDDLTDHQSRRHRTC